MSPASLIAAKLASLRRFVLRGLGWAGMLGTSALAVVPFAPSAAKVGVTRVDTSSVERQLYLVRWKDNSLNESYFIIQARAGTSGSFVSISLASPDAELAAVELSQTFPIGTQMYFRVLAVNDPTLNALLSGDEDFSAPSAAASVIIPSALSFGAPTGFAANVTGDGLVKLSWTDNATTEEAFEVQYKVLSAADDTYATLYRPAFEQHPFETSAGLYPGQSYALRIRALKGGTTTTTGTTYSQQTAFSNAITVAIPSLAAPTNFTITSIDEDSARLNWKDNSYNEGIFPPDQGSNPFGGLAEGADGSFYGTTRNGGASNSGTVFKITTGGVHTLLHSFNGTTGSNPIAGLVLGSDGNLYGTTQNGGASNSGAVFKITTGGVHTLLHSFNGTGGSNPIAGLVFGSDGNLYGTTQNGGANSSGTVFKITTGGVHTVLHSFNGTGGSNPLADLVQGADGNLYGTTQNGGANSSGTVFKITTGGVHTLLHSFSGTDGSQPIAGLVLGSDGNLYGTTQSGGASSSGTVFKITTGGVHTLLHSFNGTGGSNPRAALVQGADGNLYGTTQAGGPSGYGTVFKITTGGTHSLLYDFNSSDGPTGNSPFARLVQGADGNLYGTTQAGGTASSGTVFRITTGGLHTLLHSFNGANGATRIGGYVILQRSVGSSTYSELGTISANVEEVSNLTVIPGLPLEWQVKARHVNGPATADSSPSNTVTFTPPFHAPSEMVAVLSGKSSTEGKSRFNVTWMDNSLVESGYVVEGREINATAFDVLGSTGSNASQLVVDVPDGTQMELRVRAYYVYGGSPFYSAAATTVVVNAPNGFTSRTWHPAVKGSPMTAYQATVGSSPSRTDWELVSGPAWLVFDENTGELTGMPTEAGIQTARLSATFSDGSTDTHEIVFRVQEPEAPPQQVNNLASRTIPVGTVSIPLTELFRDADSPSAVMVDTTVGDFPIILEDKLTPLTVANFMAYVNGGDYSGVAVHRAAPGFVVQMGGYKPTAAASPDNNFTEVTKRPSPLNEPGISNLRRTVAMAKQGGDPNSATHDFFVSLGDNSGNLDAQNGSFTVFGRVPESGMTVPNQINTLRNTYNTANDQYRILLPSGESTVPLDLSDFPLTGPNELDLVSTGIRPVDKSKLIKVESVTTVPTLTFGDASSSSPMDVAAAINGNNLDLTGINAFNTSTVSVTATDLDGNASTYSFQVYVDSNHQPLTITTQPVSATIAAGTNHVLGVAVSGTDPTFQWRKDGVDIPGANSASLSVNNAGIEDHGTYQVVVASPSNIVVSDTVTLAVNAAPIITAEPVSQTLKYAASAVFAVKAKGSATLAYQWRKNDINISGATSATLTLPKIAMTDAGTYTCVVTNGFGSNTSAAATLTVTATDQDSDGLPDHEELAQGTDRFDTDSDDDGYSDGLEVAYGSNPKSAGSTPASTVVIAKVERLNILRNIAMRKLPARTGFPNGLNGNAPVDIPAMWLSTYELTNAQWAAILQHAKDNMSSVITVVDNLGAKEIHSRGNMVCRLPTHKTADAGNLGVDEVTLSEDGTTFQVSRAVAEHPVRGVSWFGAYLAAEVMNHFYGYNGKTDATNTANPTFNFEVSNGMGGFTPVNGFHVPRFFEWEHAARSGTLNQLYPTGATISAAKANYDATAFGKPKPVNAHVGNPVIGCFNLAGNVSEWIFEADVNMAGNGFTRGGGYGDPVTDTQNDAKKSRPKNGIDPGVGIRLALVDPRAPSTPTSPAPNVIVKTGAPISLVGAAIGAPPLLYQWYRDGKALAGQTKATLSIPAASLSNAGRYKLVIKNGLGSISTNESLVTVVESVARTVYVKLGGTATLTAKSKGSSNLEYQWRKDELLLANDELTKGVTTSTLKVFGPTVDSIAYYDCQVKGPGSSGTVLTGETLVVFASKPIIEVPDDISPVVVGGSFSLNQNFNDSINVTPTKWTITGLPPGMTYDPATGVISGRATKAGVYTVKVTASNVAGSTGPIQYVIAVEEFPSGSAGDFVGSIAAGTSPVDDLGGRIDLRTASSGTFTGNVVVEGVRHAISGLLATDAITSTTQAAAAKSRATVNIPRTGQNPLQLSFVLDPATNGLTGTIGPVVSPATEPAEVSKMAITGWRNVWSTTNPASTRAGKQNLHLSLPALSLNAPDAPQGEGFVTLTVASAGGTTFSGRAADGSILLFSAHLGPNGEALLFQTPYGDKGSLLGTLNVAPTTQEVTGTVRWYKKDLGATSTDRNYKDGFGPFNLIADGRPYTSPSAGQLVVGFPDAANNAKATFSPLKLNTGGSALEGSQNVIFRINTDHSASLPAATPEITLLNLMIQPGSGSFTGKVSLTDTASSVTREVNFTGLFVKNASSGQPGKGHGYLLLPHLPGAADSPLFSARVLIETNP